MTDNGHELSYSDVKCDQSALVENTTLSNTCEVVIITDEQDPGFVTTGVTSSYTVYSGGKPIEKIDFTILILYFIQFCRIRFPTSRCGEWPSSFKPLCVHSRRRSVFADE